MTFADSELPVELERALPPHVARPLVGPVVLFRHQPVVVTSSPPVSTTDPRHDACTAHHLACDCREAELAERLAELRDERSQLQADCQKVMAALAPQISGHPTLVEYYPPGRWVPERCYQMECRCVPCDFARDAGLVPKDNRRILDRVRIS